MAELNGFIKLHRKLIAWGWYQDYVVKDLFIHLLLTASFRESGWRDKTIKKGQLVTSVKHLSEDLGFSTQQIRTALSKLSSTNEITIETTNKFTFITVVNWEEYQLYNDEATNKSTSTATNEQQTVSVNKLLTTLKSLKNSTSSLTNKTELESVVNATIFELEQQLPTNKSTNNQQTNNKQITNEQQHRKNVKNYKNVKKGENIGANAPAPSLKKAYGRFKHVLLTDAEYQSLATDYGEAKTKSYIDCVDERIEQHGYRWNNHELVIRRCHKENWVKSNEPETASECSSYDINDFDKRGEALPVYKKRGQL